MAGAGTPTARTYLFDNPASGSTGVLYGTTGGQSVGIRSDLGIGRIQAVLTRQVMDVDSRGWNGAVHVGAALAHQWARTEHTIDEFNMGFPMDLRSRTAIRIKDRFTGVPRVAGIGLNHGRWRFALEAMLLPGRLRSDSHAEQHTVCQFCPPSDKDFTLTHQDSKHKSTVARGLGLKLERDLTRSLRLELSYEHNYVDRGVFRPRISPEGQSELDFERSADRAIGLTLSFSFPTVGAAPSTTNGRTASEPKMPASDDTGIEPVLQCIQTRAGCVIPGTKSKAEKPAMKQATLPVVTIAALLWSLSACAGQPMRSSPSLYDRLGGKPTITAVVDDFIANVAADARINGHFANANIPRLKEKLVEQICAGTGGPCTYTGLDMRTAHQGRNISESDFNALVEDLVKSLNKFKVPEREKSELLGILAPMKGDMVTR